MKKPIKKVPVKKVKTPNALTVPATPIDLQQLERKAALALTERRLQQEEQTRQRNAELDDILSSSVRKIVLYALRNGISTQLHSGKPHPTAVSEGAALVAQALHREGVQAHELLKLLELWETRIDTGELFVAAQQLLGPGFCKLTYDRNTPLSDLCEILFGSAHEVGDLIAAGGIVASIYRKMALIERTSPVKKSVESSPTHSEHHQRDVDERSDKKASTTAKTKAPKTMQKTGKSIKHKPKKSTTKPV